MYNNYNSDLFIDAIDSSSAELSSSQSSTKSQKRKASIDENSIPRSYDNDSNLSPHSLNTPSGMKETRASNTIWRTNHKRLKPSQNASESGPSASNFTLSTRNFYPEIDDFTSDEDSTKTNSPQIQFSKKSSRKAPLGEDDNQNTTSRSSLGSQCNPIELRSDGQLTDSDSELAYIATTKLNRFRKAFGKPTTQKSVSCGNAEDWPEVVNGINEGLRRLHFPKGSRRRSKKNIDFGATPIDSYEGNGVICRAGMGVQLRDEEFLLIKSVHKDRDNNVFLKGRFLKELKLSHFQRDGEKMCSTDCEDSQNELIWKREFMVTREVDGELTLREKPVVRYVTSVLANRDIVFTNHKFPSMSCRDNENVSASGNADVNSSPLFVRWQECALHDSSRADIENSIQHLSWNEADVSFRKNRCGAKIPTRIPDKRRKCSGRFSSPISGGSYEKRQTIWDLEGNDHSTMRRQYTFGDAFSGAGGVSRGALKAGLRISWAFDMDEKAMVSYKVNFGKHGTECYEFSVDQFLELALILDLRVDILHLSPPCQPFSQAHTIPSPEQDEINEAALLSVWELIERLQPRIVTMEETTGLENRHSEWFASVKEAFVSKGYSMRWKKALQCEEYGVPQQRKRLFIIASAPGEKLPSFPAPTHGPNSREGKGYVYIGEAIGNIPETADDHDTNAARTFQEKPAFSMNTFAKTITCGGGVRNYHPSGTRQYSVRELACLQTFPLYHLFPGQSTRTGKVKQIGNAVPPKLYEVILRSIIECLAESDGIR